ncbi:hypothetical protein CH253_08230 [Rhodococcus sp. 06-156-3C]|nr:hypothetical protein CH253_08230 [Rhodococcus sp. 06-156-3C]
MTDVKPFEGFAPQNVSVGRVVHYHSRGSADGVFKPEPRAAIVTEVTGLAVVRHSAGSEVHETDLLHLCVLNPTGMFFAQDVPYSPEPKPGHWNWPPRT